MNVGKLKQVFLTGLGWFPLTRQGCIALLAAAVALNLFAYGSLDLVVFALAVCALCIITFCLLSTLIAGLCLRQKIRRQLQQDGTGAGRVEAAKAIEVEAGFPNETGFSLAVPRFLPLARLGWQITYPDAVATRIGIVDRTTLRESIVSHKRCLSEAIVRQFSVADVLGFCRFSWKQEQQVRLQALPQSHAVKHLPVLQSLTAEDGMPNPAGEPEGDRMEIRPYAPGDSVKNIMWKVYARNRQLNVRLPERSVTHSKRTIAYLLSSENDEAAAAIARIALETGALGDDWEFGADGTANPCSELAESLRAVARSRALDYPHSYGLDQFLERSGGTGGAHCIVFAGAELAPWLEPLKQTIGRYPGQFSVILATDGMAEGQAESRPEKHLPKQHLPQQHLSPQQWWRRLAFREGNIGQANSLSNIKRLLNEMGQLAEAMVIVDRSSGQSFDRQLRKV